MSGDRETMVAQVIANLLYAREDAPIYNLHRSAAQAAIAAADADLRARLAAAEAREAQFRDRLQIALSFAEHPDFQSVYDAQQQRAIPRDVWIDEATRWLDALTDDGAALAQAINAVVDSCGSTEELCKAVDALRAGWRRA